MERCQTIPRGAAVSKPRSVTPATSVSTELHLAHVMETTPENELMRPRIRHNMHEIAWKPVSESDVVTLEWFMVDYVGHCEHHVNQALSIAARE